MSHRLHHAMHHLLTLMRLQKRFFPCRPEAGSRRLHRTLSAPQQPAVTRLRWGQPTRHAQ
eukprot:1476577-Karenia_brevis.AAC.1